MKRWYQSKINWTQYAGVLLSVLPFFLSWLDVITMAAETKAGWVLAVQTLQAVLTNYLRNNVTSEPIGDAADVAAHKVMVRAFDEKQLGA